MKVVHINEHLALKGGVETYLTGLFPMLESRNVKLHLFYGDGDAALFSDSTRIPEIGRVLDADRVVHRLISSALDEHKPDVIHIHNTQNLGVVRACIDYGPTIFTTHDFRSICPANMFFFKRTQEICRKSHADLACFPTTLVKHCVTPRPNYASAFYRRSRWYLENRKQFAHVIAPSEGARKRMLSAGFEPGSVSVLPYFCPAGPVSAPRKRPEVDTITFMGRIAQNKGQEFFVEALGLLPESVRGVLVGNLSDENRSGLEQLARTAGCLDRLEMRPWASRDEVFNVLDATTVFIFPSLWDETLGIVGLEALSRGVPVVASDVGGVREWLRHDENGLLVEPKSAEQIRDAVRYITETDERLESFGAAGIRTIREKFLPSMHADRLVELYADVAVQATSSRDSLEPV